jgi:hypothetical protein
MAAQYKIAPDGNITITFNLKLSGNFLEQEEQIAEAVSEAGRLASELALKALDTDGAPIFVDQVKYTSRGLEKKNSRPRGEK